MTTGAPEFLTSIRAHGSELTLPVLQKADPAIRAVIFTAKHVAYYRLDKQTSQWIRQAVEGPLFIAKRDLTQPNAQHGTSHCIFILNRKAMENFTCFLDPSLPVEVQDAYLMMQTREGEVVGFWFYDKQELAQADACIKQIFAAQQNNQQTNSNHNNSAPHSSPQPARHQSHTQTNNQSTSQPSQQASNHQTQTHSTPAVADEKRGPASSTNQSKPSNSQSNSQPKNPQPNNQQPTPRQTKPAPVIFTGKPLHTKAPPAPVDLAPALQGANERQLQQRLNQLLVNINSVDRDHAAKHADLVKSQIQPSKFANSSSESSTSTQSNHTNGSSVSSTTSNNTNTRNQSNTSSHHVPLDHLFQSITMSSTSSSLPAMPISSIQSNQPQFIDSASLERSFARNRQPSTQNPSQSSHHASSGLNSVVSAMFNQQQQQQYQPVQPPQSQNNALPVPPRGLNRDQYAQYLRSLLDRSDLIDYWFSQYQKSQSVSEQPALFFV